MEEDLLIRVTEDEGICIPTIEEIVRLHEKSKPLYLCSDDMQEKKKLKAVCKEVDHELQKMTGLKLVKFELHINDVKTREELKADNKSS